MSALPVMPDLPGYVHGIKSINPWIVQCDGCGGTRSGAKASEAILGRDRIEFNPRANTPEIRMCHACWIEAGWHDEYTGWVKNE